MKKAFQAVVVGRKKLSKSRSGTERRLHPASYPGTSAFFSLSSFGSRDSDAL